MVKTIFNAKAISLSDLNTRWLETDMSGGVEMSRTTFYRHKCAIEDMFGIYIECDRKNGNKYYIGNEEVLREESVQNWMLSTLSVSNMLGESQSLHQRILLENIPSGDEKLQVVINAMKENRQVMMTYRRYGSPASNSFTLAPYCIKLFHQRWYLLGCLSNVFWATFSFDRMEEVKMTPTKFKLPEDFDASEYFSESYGIVVNDKVKTERI
ncbi:MAG: WYL domain-containing protein, partial [Prevotella sp.]|nr:WYL domain-containing protein [Prevotella sp.]